MTLLWKPLLSATVPMDSATGDFDWACVPLPVYVSLKYDGYRAMVQGGVLVSRNGLPVRNKELQARYGRPEYDGLDGELVDGPPSAPGAFGRTSSVVKKADADASKTKFYVIDYVAGKNAVPFTLGQRVSVLNANRDKMNGTVVIKQTLVRTLARLKVYEAKAVASGWEGVMLRRADQGAYPQKRGKENRSTLREFYLARLKRFEHGDAEILAVHPLRHNVNTERTARGARSTKKSGIVTDARLVGSATLKDKTTGVEFDTNVNGDALRAWDGWQDPARWRGKVVRYKWQVCGTKDKPRINTCGFEELCV